MSKFILYFASVSGMPELESWMFQAADNAQLCEAERSGIAEERAFRWTSAVRGLCELLVNAALCISYGLPPEIAEISGARKTPAASLDDALYQRSSSLHQTLDSWMM